MKVKLKKEEVEKLVEKSKNGAYFRAKQFFKDDADIEDALQIAYVKAFKKIDQLDNRNNFNNWFNKIVVNTCKDQLKKRKDNVFSDISKEDTEIDVEDYRININPSDAMNYQDTKEIISNMLHVLPDVQRITLYLYYYDNYSIKEISDYFEVSEATVKSRLRYGKTAMKENVEKYQKTHDIKLYSTSIVPLLTYSLFNIEEYTKCPNNVTVKLVTSSIKKSITNVVIKRVAVAVMSISIVVGGIFYYFNSQDEIIELRAKTITAEYGETISKKPEDYLINKNIELLKEVKISFDEENEEYLSLGQHDVEISYREQKLTLKVVVKDTIKPEFVEYKEELEFEEGSEEVDFLSYFKAKDLSDVEIHINKEKLDMNIPGEYTLIVTASDLSGNENTIELKVKIKEKEEKEVEQTVATNAEQQTTNTGSPQVNATPSTTYDMSNPVVARAIELVGTVNEGGMGEAGIGGSFVCDDLAREALAAGGISYGTLRSSGTRYPYSQVQPGDLLVYAAVSGSGVSGHVAIYIGNGMAVHGNFLRVTTIYSATGLPNLQEPYVLR